MLLKAVGILDLLLGVYYGQFFLRRGEAVTLIQLVVLLCAATWLLLYEQPTVARSVWFRGWLPVAWPGWAMLGAAGLLAVLVFLTVDRTSHSVSDTLTGIAPTYALLVALVLRVRAERTIAPN